MSFSGFDRLAQEDSLRIDWREAGPLVRIGNHAPLDFTRQSNGAMELAFFVRNLSDTPAALKVGLGCESLAECKGGLNVNVASRQWQEVRLSLACFEELGADLSAVSTGILLATNGPASIGLSDVRLAPDIDAKRTCEF